MLTVTVNTAIKFVCAGIIDLAKNHKTWAKDYDCTKCNTEFVHKSLIDKPINDINVDSWFDQEEF